MGMATCSSSSSMIVPSKAALKPPCSHPIFSTFQIPTSPVPKANPYEHLNIAPNLDGTITRLLDAPIVEANPEATHGDAVVCKDLTLIAEKKTWVRVYRPTRLPSNDNTVARLPIIIYFHGGGFVNWRASMKMPHQRCSDLASEIPAIVASLDYRLAPEHRLPAQYEDAIDAILWVKQQFEDPNGEQWLKEYGDCSRCYLNGRGSGGNMVFNSALRVLDLDLNPLKIAGLILNQPMFGGNERKNSELMFVDDPALPLAALDLLWKLSLPEGTDRDHPFCNPVVEGAEKRKMSSLGRCLVTGFFGDVMFDRMQDLVEMLVMRGVKVEVRFHDPDFHNVDLVDQHCARAITNSIKEFVI
ncbi:probable carboxylesterase 9 [Manihot esculenta]|uniref:Alpha/beta hydrolase fold-3 domain-containing protein n=1 Tax=Manihot esculenta TaxID=3983 RepID=A0A2C9WP90_MANES|nr:probable carboxylesterase 9 [Manihot esculenta]